MRFERELATAEALQRSLLPDQLPVLQDADLATRYVPGGVGLKVGGDWYDAVPLRDGRVMLVIGDVVGHGVRAAASMGKLRNVLQYSALDGLDPARGAVAAQCVLLRADRRGHGHVDRRRVRPGSAARPLRERRTSARDAAAAGRHRRDARRRAGRCRCARATRPSTSEAERDLPAGSMLVLYTDGLIERRGESLDVGLERLAKTLRGAPACGRGRRGHAAARLPRRRRARGRRRAALRRRAWAGGCAAAPAPARPPASSRVMRRATWEWLDRLGATGEEIREITVAVNEAGGERDRARVRARRRGLRRRGVIRWRRGRVRSPRLRLVAHAPGDAGDRGRGLDLARGADGRGRRATRGRRARSSACDAGSVEAGRQDEAARGQSRCEPDGDMIVAHVRRRDRPLERRRHPHAARRRGVARVRVPRPRPDRRRPISTAPGCACCSSWPSGCRAAASSSASSWTRTRWCTA